MLLFNKYAFDFHPKGILLCRFIWLFCLFIRYLLSTIEYPIMVKLEARMKLKILLLICLFPFIAYAQIAITNVAVFDGTNTTLLTNKTVLIRNSKIEKIQPAAKNIPNEYKQIAGEGYTLMPGLFDLHTHIAVSGANWADAVFLSNEYMLRSHLWSGVTTVVDLFSTPDVMVSVRAKKDAALYPEVLFSGPLFTVPKGHGTQFGVQAATITSTKELQIKWQDHLKAKPDLTKAVLEHGKWGGLPEFPTLNKKMINKIGKLSKKAKLPLFVHVWSVDEAKTAVRAGATALAHGVFSGKVDQELIDLMKKNNTAYIPTLAVVLNGQHQDKDHAFFKQTNMKKMIHPKVFASVTKESNYKNHKKGFAGKIAHNKSLFFDNLMALYNAGIKIGVGTDAGNPFVLHGSGVHQEIKYLVEAGIPLAKAMVIATATSADIIGKSSLLGQIKAGYTANAMLVKGNPLTDIDALGQIKMVFHQGKMVDRELLAALNIPKKDKMAKAAGKSVSAKTLGALIDDFTAGNGNSAYKSQWTTWSDSIAQGKSTANCSFDSKGILKITGEITEGFAYGPWAGVRFPFAPDVSAESFTGIEMKIRGTKRKYSFSVGNSLVKDYNVFATALDIDKEWGVLKIPFSQLKQIGFGQPVEWSSKTLTGLVIDAREAYGSEFIFGEFWLEIDYVTFY